MANYLVRKVEATSEEQLHVVVGGKSSKAMMRCSWQQDEKSIRLQNRMISQGSTAISRVNSYGRTHVTREGMEERPILIILKIFIKLMVPNDARRSVHVHQFEMKHAARLVLDKCNGTLQARVGPLIGIGVSVVNPRRRDMEDVE